MHSVHVTSVSLQRMQYMISGCVRSEELPFLDLARSSVRDRVVAPISSIHTLEIVKCQAYRDLCTVFRRFGRLAHDRAHISRDPSWTTCVDGYVRVLLRQDRCESVHASLGDGVRLSEGRPSGLGLALQRCDVLICQLFDFVQLRCGAESLLYVFRIQAQ